MANPLGTTQSGTSASTTVARRSLSRRTLLVAIVFLAALGALVPQFGIARQPGAESAATGFTGVLREEIQAGAAVAAASSQAELVGSCQDTRAYALESWKVSGTYRWYYNAKSAPKTVAATAIRAISNATGAVTRGSNVCGIRPAMKVSQSYLGATSRGPQVGSNGNCAGNDGYSVAGWTRMSSDALAVTCTYFSRGKVLASDVAVNTKYAWFTSLPSGCRYAFDLQSVMTHERGHTFGLGHVDPSAHRGQTMTTTVPPCNTTKRTLGGGDLAGLMRLYS